MLLFVDAFAFKDRYRLSFEPSDRILDIYKATTGKWGVDSMEFETLADNLKEEYQLNLDAVWTDDLTLGQLFAQTVSAQQGAPADAKSRAAER